MNTFLDHYFGELEFEEMRLDVSGANLPARHLYRKLGFQQLYSFWLAAPYSGKWKSTQEKRIRRHFHAGKERFFEMRLRANDWRRLRASLE
jgi:RimJ/RimL family protein N-acetyltransferase